MPVSSFFRRSQLPLPRPIPTTSLWRAGNQVAHTATQARPTSAQAACWGILIVANLVLSLWNYHPFQFGAHLDDSSYLILAKSLVYSDRYGMINGPGEPDPGKYPFGYPLLLVPFVVGFPNNFDALKLSSTVATILNISILFWGWRFLSKTRSYWWGLAVAGMYGLSPLTIDFSRQVMSEPLFTLLCLLVIVLTEQVVRSRPNRGLSLALGTALVFTMYIRSIGVVLVLSVLIYLFLVKGKSVWREIVSLLVQGAIVLGLIIVFTPAQSQDLLPIQYLRENNARFLSTPVVIPSGDNSTGTPSTANQILDSWDQKIKAAHSLLYLAVMQHLGPDLRAIAFPIGGGKQEQDLAERIDFPSLPLISNYAVSLIVIAGLIRALKLEKFSLFLLFAVFYFLAISLWFWSEPRFLYPIQPQIFFCLLMGLEGGFLWIVSKTVRPRISFAKAIFGLLVVLLMAGLAIKSGLIDDSRLHTGDVELRSSWLKLHSPPTAVIMTEAPGVDYIYSDRKTVPYPRSLSSASEFEAYLTEQDISHILIAPPIEWQDRYTPHYSHETERVLKLIGELDTRQRVDVVFELEPALIEVYQVKNSSGSTKE